MFSFYNNLLIALIDPADILKEQHSVSVKLESIYHIITHLFVCSHDNQFSKMMEVFY